VKLKIKRALLSVWDKDRIIELGKFLADQNIEILSTGGTKKVLEKAGLDITSISFITGSGAVMDGRVKTLHPKIFGGILADRENPQHVDDLEDLHGLAIDLVVVNFYPFVQEAAEKKLKLKKAIEFIDIGGPSMLRAAAKNYHSVLPLCDTELYSEFMDIFIETNGAIPLDFRKKMAASVFSLTAEYETAIYNFFIEGDDELPEHLNINLEKLSELRYGENPHQQAAFYIQPRKSLGWDQHQGKQLSYNNYTDMESAYSIPHEFDEHACAIIKHSNPCGFGLGDNTKEAFDRAVSTDPVSYFGGIVGFNQQVDTETAHALVQPFLECIIAPSFSEEASEILKKKKNMRIISVNADYNEDSFFIKSVAGGYLYQQKDSLQEEVNNLNIVTKRKPTDNEYSAMELGWKLVRQVKSNAIVLADKTQLLGVGAGQMSRIDSVKLAIQKVTDNGLNLSGSIMASDAFFPFSDSVELAAAAGITAIIQPGGSIKDDEVIKVANKFGIAMAFTGARHFLH